MLDDVQNKLTPSLVFDLLTQLTSCGFAEVLTQDKFSLDDLDFVYLVMKPKYAVVFAKRERWWACHA